MLMRFVPTMIEELHKNTHDLRIQTDIRTVTDVDSDPRILVPDCHVREEFLVNLGKKKRNSQNYKYTHVASFRLLELAHPCDRWYVKSKWNSYYIHQWSSRRAHICRSDRLKRDEIFLEGSLHLLLQWAEPDLSDQTI